jgi:hypothetical protein
LRQNLRHASVLPCARVTLISPSVPRSTMNLIVQESLQLSLMLSLLVGLSLSSVSRVRLSYGQSVDEEDEHHHPPPPLSPLSSPSPPPSRSSSCCEPPSPVIRSGRGKNRYSPLEIKIPSARKGKLVHQRFCSDGEEPKKPRKRREVVSLACYFCRRRKIACRQPPADSADRTCK